MATYTGSIDDNIRLISKSIEASLNYEHSQLIDRIVEGQETIIANAIREVSRSISPKYCVKYDHTSNKIIVEFNIMDHIDSII